MAENSNNTTQLENHATNVQIIHNDGGWGNSVRSVFIYATGALRLSLLRGGGTPASRAFIIGSTLATEAGAKFLHNAINDPNYVRAHMDNWRIVWKNNNPSGGTAEIHVNKDLETTSLVEAATSSENFVPPLGEAENFQNKDSSNISEVNNFIPDGRNTSLDEFSNKIFNSIIDFLSPILTPVKVGYSNELLADQLNYISIILFLMSIFIIVLLLAFMFNILIFIYSDKISKIFTNKYIKWYINFNKKIIAIELIFLGSSILYFMLTLSYGIHFLATHPIIFN